MTLLNTDEAKYEVIVLSEYEKLRIQLLKTLLQMEEKMLAGVEKEPFRFFASAENKKEDLSCPKSDVPMKAVFSVLELSDYLGVSTDCIYMMVRENQIPYVRIRRRILFNKESINSWIHGS